MPPPTRRLSLVLLLYLATVLVNGIKFPFSSQADVPPKGPVTLEEGRPSCWDQFKGASVNASATLVPTVGEACRRAPGYVVQAGLSTGRDMFVPPKITRVMSVGYLAVSLARLRGDVGGMCQDMGKSFLGSPGVHLAIVGITLRLTLFRTWRRLFVRASLFRLRYQLIFRRISRPRWLAGGDSPTEVIVRDTATAARTAQGLFPDLCYEMALIAKGCGVAYWPDCCPSPLVEKGWGALRELDRRLCLEFGQRARRARPEGRGRSGPGFLGWRIPHRVALRVVRCGVAATTAPVRMARRGCRRGEEKEGEEATRLTVIVGEDGKTEAVVEEIVDEIGPEESNPREMEAPGSWGQPDPPPGPLLLLHDVTPVPSLGSTLTKSYRAFAELPCGDGIGRDAAECTAPPGFLTAEADPAGGVGREVGSSFADTPPRPRRLEAVVIKRTAPVQHSLAADDVVAARRSLRRMTFRAGLDLDLSGVLAEAVTALARSRDMRIEAENVGRLRENLGRVGMLGAAVGLPEVISCPELGPLARRGLLVTKVPKGVFVSDAYVMEHAAPRGGKERVRFLERLFAAFGHMCLIDGCFPSDPRPENILYMCNGEVGLTDLSSVCDLTGDQRQGLCRLYLTMEELSGEDPANPSPVAERRARLAMESVGLVIDLPPAGGRARGSPPAGTGLSSKPGSEEMATAAVGAVRLVDLPAKEGCLDDDTESGHPRGDAGAEDDAGPVQGGVMGAPDGGRGRIQPRRGEDGEGRQAAAPEVEDGSSVQGEGAPSKAPLTHVMLLRGLFDTRAGEVAEMIGGDAAEMLRSMAVRRLPQSMVPVLRMVASLRSICTYLEVDTSLLPQFARAASRALQWRLTFTKDRRGGYTGTGAGSGMPPLQTPASNGAGLADDPTLPGATA